MSLALQDIIRKFVEQMPTSLDSFQRKFSKLVEDRVLKVSTCHIDAEASGHLKGDSIHKVEH